MFSTFFFLCSFPNDNTFSTINKYSRILLGLNVKKEKNINETDCRIALFSPSPLNKVSRETI